MKGEERGMDEAEVKVVGAWASPFSCRVIWALKLKGIPYTYIDEDLSNKSELLLQSNPVHKKIPVVIHGGRTICESMIILEYIEETWPQCPLLPSHPHHKAIARFWINFADTKGIYPWLLFRAKTESDREKATKDTKEMLKDMEEKGLGSKKFFGGEEISMVDIAFGWIAHWLGVIEQVVGVEVLDAHQFPLLIQWIHNFKEIPTIRENLPDRDNMLTFFRSSRAKLLASP